MKKAKKAFLSFGFIFIIAGMLVFDLFINIGQPATFDGTTHITTLAQFYSGLKDGEIRVMWGDGFANYGMPIPLISQQTTPYLGAVSNFLFHNVVTSFNAVFFLGALFSAFFYYLFLRIYFKPNIALAGTFLFNFAPYRIINIYIRGAQPEFFAGVFIPLILIAIYLIVKKKNIYGIPLLIFSTALLVLTHPFLFIISSFIFIPYFLYCIMSEKHKRFPLLQTIAAVVCGVGLTAFYTIPLFLEIKYFYYGAAESHLVPNQFLGFANYFDPNWYYFYKDDVFVRGNFIKAGLFETLITATGVLYLLYARIKKQKEPLLFFAVAVSFLIIFLTTAPSQLFYETVSLLDGIQHPWRMLSALIFVTPIIACILLQKVKYQTAFVVFFIFLIAFLRFPQVYGKNYTVYPQQQYFFNPENLHGNVLNTVWTGKTSEYPVKKTKPEIISGDGTITTAVVKNSSRHYEIVAAKDLRMADNTFYFPGWNVYIDGRPTTIEYQDPNHRGVITYNVPKGKHIVDVKFELTKVRMLGYGVSAVALVISLLYIVLLWRKK